MRDEKDIARAIAEYYYNVDSDDWAAQFEATLQEGERRVYAALDVELPVSNWHPNYRKERQKKFERGFESHWGTLDSVGQAIQMRLILERADKEDS